MGYSRNELTLKKMLPALRDAATDTTGEEHWQWDFRLDREALEFAYKMREAMAIAREMPEEYPELQLFSRVYRISTKGSHVIASPRGVVGGGSGTVGKQAVSAAPPPSSASVAVHKQGGSAAGRQTAASIAQLWSDKQIGYFPEAQLDGDELCKLHTWCQLRELVIFEADGSVTLRVATDEIRDLGWSPEDLVGQ